MICSFFFFKQKTAYEMRISDWSSDVCSSDEFAAFAAALADAAGPIIRGHFRTGLTVDTKADASPVTAADRAVEKRLREMIEARWPEHGIAGEEYGLKTPDAEFVWSLDPIDGTKAFITGRPKIGRAHV